MLTFSTSAITQGSVHGVLESAIATLTHHGFSISHRDAKSACLVGPGMTSTRQNPLLGASKITLLLRHNTIDADAELGGVDGMQKFLMWFPWLLGIGLGLLLGVGGGILFGQQFGVGFGVPWANGWQWIAFAFGVAILPVAPWLFLSPIVARRIRQRTQAAIETLVRNAALSAQT
jgi:hypothetical protein